MLPLFEGYSDTIHPDFYEHPSQRRVANFWSQARTRHRGNLKLRAKSEMAWFWLMLRWLVKVVTFGKGMDLYDGTFTTLGRTIWVPGDGRSWDTMSGRMREGLLRHEVAHIDTSYLFDPDAQDHIDRKYGLARYVFGWLFGTFLHPVLYIIGMPLPYGFAYYRAWFEFHGYKRNMQMHISAWNGTILDQLTSDMHNKFASWSYGKMATNARAAELVNDMVTDTVARWHSGSLLYLCPDGA